MKQPLKNLRLAEAISAAIAKRDVFIWGRSPDNRPGGRIDYQIDAISVVMNGPFIQIKLDPKYRIVEV